MQNNTLGVFIGRFQPLHAGHRELIRVAARQSRTLLLLVGSANSPRTVKNPFTFKERESVLCEFLAYENISNVLIVPVNDYKYSDTQWLTDINSIVNIYNPTKSLAITIFGFDKEGNDYLKWFPQYKYFNIASPYALSATDVRKSWFENAKHRFNDSVVADGDYFKKEAEQFKDYPYKESLNFNCADPIIECCGHVLLIQRGRAPGIGNWGFPGGFKNANETFIDAALRELVEEVGIKVPEKVLRGSIIATKLFDSPTRAAGGIPRNSLAVYISINANNDGSLPKLTGPAEKGEVLDYKWVPISSALNDIFMHDDHADMLSVMCGVLPMPAHTNPRFK